MLSLGAGSNWTFSLLLLISAAIIGIGRARTAPLAPAITTLVFWAAASLSLAALVNSIQPNSIHQTIAESGAAARMQMQMQMQMHTAGRCTARPQILAQSEANRADGRARVPRSWPGTDGRADGQLARPMALHLIAHKHTDQH